MVLHACAARMGIAAMEASLLLDMGCAKVDADCCSCD